MSKIREMITRIVESLQEGNSQVAYALLTQVLPLIESVIGNLDQEQQTEWVMILQETFGKMQQQDLEGLSDILQNKMLKKIDVMCLLYGGLEKAGEFANRYRDIHEKGSVIFVYGLGDGAYIEELEKVCQDKAIIVVYEPVNEVVDITSKKFPVVDYFTTHPCILFTDALSSDEENIFPINRFEEKVEQIIGYSNRNFLYQAVLPGYQDICEQNYRDYYTILQYRLMQVEMNVNNSESYGKLAIRNSCKMLQYLPESCSGYSMKNIFHNEVPAVIVSAGPSLEKNVHLLKNVKGKAFIVCVDSAVAYLLEQGIIPDAVVTIDPRKPVRLFEDSRIEGVPIIAASDANTDIIAKVHPDRFIIAQSDDPYIQHAFSRAGKPLDRVKTGGCVSIFAFNLCLYAGAGPVILIGQDFAFSEEKIYAGQNNFNVNVQQYIEIEGMDGNKVYTTPDYNHYRIWFENYLKNHESCQLVNATEGGARIKGCPAMSFEKAISEYVTKDYDLQEIIHSIPQAFGGEEKALLVEQTHKKKEIFRKLCTHLKQGKMIAEKGFQLSIKNGTNHIAQYTKLNSQLQEILVYCDECDEMFQVRRQVETERKDLDLLVNIYAVEGYDATPREQYRKMKDFFTCMLDAAEKVKKLYEEI